MATKESITTRFGDKVEEDSLKFLEAVVTPFTAITTETLEAAMIAFKASIKLWFWKPISPVFELDGLYQDMIRVDLTEAVMQKVLDITAFVLMRSGKFRKPAYLLCKKDDGFLVLDVSGVPLAVKNKMIYVLSFRISFLLRTTAYESAIVNMIETVKAHKIVHGREYCFLKSHVLVDGPERPILKREVQLLFYYGLGKVADDQFWALVEHHKYIKLKRNMKVRTIDIEV